jgi:hypothetical protein
MRYLSLLAAILASTPVCAAEFTDTIELRPGVVERWQAPRPYSQVYSGDPNVVDVIPGKTRLELIITMKPEGGTTNIVLTDEDGKLIANVLVTNPAPEYQAVRSAETGTWQMYRNDDKCFPVCVRNNAPTKPTKPTIKAQPEANAGGS